MQNALNHEYLYDSECCSVSSIRLENYHIFKKGLAKNTFTICMSVRHSRTTMTKLRIFFYGQHSQGYCTRQTYKAVSPSMSFYESHRRRPVYYSGPPQDSWLFVKRQETCSLKAVLRGVFWSRVLRTVPSPTWMEICIRSWSQLH